MALAKAAQLDIDGIKIKPEDLDLFEGLNELGEDIGDLQVELQLSPETEEEEEILEQSETEPLDISGEIMVEVDDEPLLTKQFSFSLPEVPGGLSQEEVEEPEIEVNDEAEHIQVEHDPWSWTLGNAMEWLQDRLDAIPKHSGKSVPGIERALSYLKKVLGEISKMVKLDYDNQLDINALEDARNEILNGIDRLEDRMEKLVSYRNKKKKRADLQSGIIKEGQKASGFQINVSAFIAGLARLLINSHVSAGHDLDSEFDKVVKKFNLTPREQFELSIVLSDHFAFPLRRDRFFLPGEDIDTTSTDNHDWSAQYPG